MEGRKDDTGKLRFDLVDPKVDELFVAVLTHGAGEYGDDNWRLVPNAKRRYYAALRRHLNSWYAGERLDPKSGLPHLAHVLCNAHFLLALEIT